MNAQRHYIFKTLDNPMRVVFWSIDEFLIMVIPLFIGFILANVLILLSGIVLKFFYAKLKKKNSNQSFKHLLYWYLPTHNLKKQGIVKNFPDSHVREFLL
ncbi:type IV conjugative transfer system protein TraL [Parachlamydia sp. C2]|uniref:type IV conjugative transfer system protein TraL n=1 Tax=Candidatus Protochlamydia phocaeensis TaxID=1414722 RepID=UPI000837D2C6